jgi:hypothetical protein
MGMSIRGYAAYRGVSHKAVQKALRSGRISKESDGTIDPARADAGWERNTRLSVTAPVCSTGVQNENDEVYRKARAMSEFYEARKLKKKFDDLDAKLVSADEYKAECFAREQKLRDRLRILPKMLAPQIIKLTDFRDVVDLIDDAIRDALDDLSGKKEMDDAIRAAIEALSGQKEGENADSQ